MLVMPFLDEATETQTIEATCPRPGCSPPGSSVHGILQARIWSGWPFPSPGDLPNPGTELRSSAFQANYLPCEPPGKPIDELSGI